jgi:hypothetical protein
MMHSSARLIFSAQVSLFGFLFICFLLLPHFLLEANEGGVSNYGIHLKTIVPYTLGFGICGTLTLRAARVLPQILPRRHVLQRSLYVLGTLYVFALLSTYPYKLNATFDAIHQDIGVILALFMLALGAWLVLALARSTVNILFFTAQCAGFMLAALTYFGLIHVLFIAELLMSSAFGMLLVRSMNTLSGNAAVRTRRVHLS